MRRPKFTLLAAGLLAPVLFGGCETTSRYENESAIPATTNSGTRVLKDEIPAEGQRKIPVVEQY
jgi:hypothetical protein